MSNLLTVVQYSSLISYYFIFGIFNVFFCFILPYLQKANRLLHLLASLVLFSLSPPRRVSRDSCVIDATDGTAATLGAFWATDCRILILRSVLLLSICQESRACKDFSAGATSFHRFAVSSSSYFPMLRWVLSFENQLRSDL